jgi:hypothetical protein
MQVTSRFPWGVTQNYKRMVHVISPGHGIVALHRTKAVSGAVWTGTTQHGEPLAHQIGFSYPGMIASTCRNLGLSRKFVLYAENSFL